MNRRTAKAIHASTNLAYWFENPDWNPDVPAIKIGKAVVKALPFNLYEAQKHHFFDTDKVIAVSGESVVAKNGIHQVNKYMFRYPRGMSLARFNVAVTKEVNTVTSQLKDVALPTKVGIKRADIFKRGSGVNAVTQTQLRLNLDKHPALDLPALIDEAPSPSRDRTAQDLEKLLEGAAKLTMDYGFYPDVAYSSGNLRRRVGIGKLMLIDVMPIHEDGSRLIGDHPPDLIPHTVDNLTAYAEFVGEYGA